MTHLENQRVEKMAAKLGVTKSQLLYSFLRDGIEGDENYNPFFRGVSDKPDTAIRIKIKQDELDVLTEHIKKAKITKSDFLRGLIREKLGMAELGKNDD